MALLTALAGQAQPDPIKFGKPDPQILTAGAFAGDSASAIVLCDYGISNLVGAARGFQMEFKRVTRLKILKKSGFRWATVEVPLWGSQDQLVGLRGTTYNLVNGAVVPTKLDDDGKYTDDLTKHIRLRKFTMPNVREGSVVEFTYTVVSNSSASIQDWQFQYDIPVHWSEYRISYPEYFDYKIVLQGYLPLAVQEQKEGSTIVGNQSVRSWNYRWAMKDVPAFVKEPFITTPRDYLARVDVELSSFHSPTRGMQFQNDTWLAFDTNIMLDDSFGGQLDQGGFLKDDLAKLALAPTAGQLARIAAVHGMVRDAVKFNDSYSALTSASLRRTYLELHRGNAADVNLLLVAALRQANINANPVLLSTRDHGRLNVALPLRSKFNYVVAHVLLPDGQDMLLDATDPLLPAGTLPLHCLSQVGRLVMKNGVDSRWLDIKPAQRRGHFQQLTVALTPEGRLSGKVHEEYTGYAAATERATLTKLGEPKYRSQRLTEHSDWTVPTFAVAARTELAKPLALDYEFVQAGDGPAKADALYLGLLSDFCPAQNPFQHEARSYPVDFGMAQEEVVLVALTLPAGYELAETPKGAIVDLPDEGGRYLYTISSAEGTVQLMSRLVLRKPVYEAAEYVHLRELYRLMLEKQAEKLVIKKKA